MNTILPAVLLLTTWGASAADGADRVLDIRDFGAQSGGQTLCTAAIQQAIDSCAAQGGGTVLLPSGSWLSGTLYLKSHVALHLEQDGTLLGSRDRSDYGQRRAGDPPAAFAYPAILAGENLQNVRIGGEGTIDGQGAAFRDKDQLRPKGIYLAGCRDVLIENITLRNAGSWMQHYRDCERLTIRGIRVFNHVSYNNDGLNIDSCREVTISDCRVDSDDDAIVLKSLSRKPCRDVTIRGCVVSSHCNAIKLGTESGGGFQNIQIADCQVHSPRESQVIYGRQRGLAGIALEIVDGGTLEQVDVSQIRIEGVTTAIFLRLGNRARVYEPGGATPGVGKFSQVTLSQITATDTSEIGCSITGLPGHPITAVTLSDITIGFDGGVAAEAAERAIDERESAYPECTMFGILPAYGFFCRHAQGLTFRNVKLHTAKPDLRPAMVFEDVQDLVLEGLRASQAAGGPASIRLTDVRGASLRDCPPSVTAEPPPGARR